MADAPRFDLPTIEGETRPYWDAARERRLLIKRCDDCGRAHHYPRPFCPSCWSSNVQWEDASGRATLYTWSVVHRNDLPPFTDKVPYVTAIVELEEGPRMSANVEDCPFDQLRAGMALAVEFRVVTDDLTVPIFRPA